MSDYTRQEPVSRVVGWAKKTFDLREHLKERLTDNDLKTKAKTTMNSEHCGFPCGRYGMLSKMRKETKVSTRP